MINLKNRSEYINKKKILIDCSLVIEFFLGRQDYQTVIDATIEYLKSSSIQVYITSLSVARLHFYIGINDPSIAEDALVWLEQTLEIKIIDIELKDVILAENNDVDREVEKLVAEEKRLDGIITLFPGRYKSASLEIIPAEYFISKSDSDIKLPQILEDRTRVFVKIFSKIGDESRKSYSDLYLTAIIERELIEQNKSRGKLFVASDLEHNLIEQKKNKTKILIDSQLVLDLFLDREQRSRIVDRVMEFLKSSDIEIYITSLSVSKLYFYLGFEKPNILDRAIIWLEEELKAQTIDIEIEDMLLITGECIDTEVEVRVVNREKLDGILTSFISKYEFHQGEIIEIDDIPLPVHKKSDNNSGLTQLKIWSEELKILRSFVNQRLRNLPPSLIQSNTLNTANVLTECWLSLDKRLKCGERIPVHSNWFYQESIKIILNYCELENKENPSESLNSKLESLRCLLKQSKFQIPKLDRNPFHFVFAHLESYETKDAEQEIINEDLASLLDKGFYTRNFIDRDLSGIDLSMLDLSNVNFTNAILFHTNFSGANLAHCDFTNATLTETIFERSNLEHATFNNARRMDRANFNFANLTRAKFLNVKQSNSSQFTHSELEWVTFDGSEIYGANFRSANLQHTSFKEAKLTKSSFRCANLTDANLSNSILIQCSFKGAKLYRAKLVGANLNRAELIRANLKEADLSNAKLRGANLNNVVMNRAILENADLSPDLGNPKINTQMICGKATDVNFNGAILSKIQARRSNFRNAQFNDANLEDAILQNANFEYSFLIKANLHNADLGGAILTKANLYKADLSDARLSGASLKNAILKEVDLQRAKLHGAYLYEVDLQKSNLSFCKAERANFNLSNLTRAKLISSELTNASFIDCKLFYTNFNGAKLAGAILDKANLFRANLTSALLRGASLKRTNLKEATLNKVEMQGAYLKDAILTRAKINNADLSGCRLKRSHLEYAELTNSSLDGSDLKYAILHKAKLDNAKLYLANLMGSDCSEASFKSVDLSKANLSETLLFKVDLSNSKLARTDFSGADMRGSTLKNTNLFKSRFLATNLEGANLVSSNCCYAYFADTNLDGATFNSVDLRHAYFSNVNLATVKIDNNCQLEKCVLIDSHLPTLHLESRGFYERCSTIENAYEEYENNQLIDAEEMLEYFHRSIEQLEEVYDGFRRKLPTPVSKHVEILKYMKNQINFADMDYKNAESIFREYFQSPENFEVNSLQLLIDIHQFICQIAQYRNEVIQICRDPQPVPTNELLGKFVSNQKFEMKWKNDTPIANG